MRTGALILPLVLLLNGSTRAANVEVAGSLEDTSWSLAFILAFVFAGVVIYAQAGRHRRRSSGLKRATGVARLWS